MLAPQVFVDHRAGNPERGLLINRIATFAAIGLHYVGHCHRVTEPTAELGAALLPVLNRRSDHLAANTLGGTTTASEAERFQIYQVAVEHAGGLDVR
ncbi:hypothetical protein D3C86_1369200 [compost metagenome]